jgi:hypothetical protein
MNKQQYFEMCEMLGSDPVEEEIPIEYDDLPLEVQEAFQVYNILTDSWEGMSGTYMGKNYSGIYDIMNILGIEDKVTTLRIVEYIDYFRRDSLNSKKSKSPTAQA